MTIDEWAERIREAIKEAEADGYEVEWVHSDEMTIRPYGRMGPERVIWRD